MTNPVRADAPSANPPTLVSAGAGSGKTWRIVQSILDLVRGGVSIDHIAAVTFTEAAAAELQDRIRAGLLAHGLREEAARVDAAMICTIHGFALNLLQRYPLAAALPPEPLVLDELAADSMRRAILIDVMRDTNIEAFRALIDEFTGGGVGLSARGRGDDDTPAGRLQSLVGDVLEKCRSLSMDGAAITREGERAAARLDAAMGVSGDAEALDRELSEALARALAHVEANPTPSFKKDEALYEALRKLRAEARVSPFEAALRLEGHEVSKALAPVMGGLLEKAARAVAAHPELRRRIGDGVRGVFALAAHVHERYGAEKQRIGAVDFEDMQLVALDLIAGRRPGGEAYASLVARLVPHVVVDEFQDTSPLQFRLFEALREAGARVRYVGDLKQGIYGFRAADSTLFAALLARASSRGESVEALDRSRRSRPELVAFSNALFADLMPAYGIEFAPLTADNDYTQKPSDKAHPSIDVVYHPQHRVDARVRAGVAQVIARVREGTPVLDRASRTPRPARFGDVAVLAYTHDTLDRWAMGFRAAGVSTVLSSRGLYDTLEAQLAQAWLRMLASPRDRAASAAVLLSELYGVSQRTMVRLVLARVAGSPRRALELAEREPETLPLTPYESRALARCRDDLEACREALRHLPLPDAVELAFERVGLAERLSMRLDATGAAQVRANLGALVAVARGLATRGDVGLTLSGATGATVENLLLAFEQDARRDPLQPLATDDAPDAVRLVTVHGSKGMEYPVVVLDLLSQRLQVRLPRVEVLRPTDAAALLGAGALEASGVQLVPEMGADHWRERFRELFDGARRTRQEWLRLFYVAVTRARDHLVLMWPEIPKTGTTYTLRSLVNERIAPPPPPPPKGAVVGKWLGVAVSVARAAETAEEEAHEPEPDLSAWRALAENTAPEAAGVEPPRETAPRLERVTPSELCEVADCPEVPRLVRFAVDGRHELARTAGIAVVIQAIPEARALREVTAEKITVRRAGEILRAVVERAPLVALAADQGERDRALITRALAMLGQVEHEAECVAAMTEALAAVRAAVQGLGAIEDPARAVPFTIDVGGTTLGGTLDLVVRSDAGLHVVALREHPVKRDDLAREAAWHRPGLDAYALAVHKLTGQRLAGRHLVVPATGACVSLAGDFHAGHAETELIHGAALLARGARGPAQDCATCGWRNLCRVGRSVLANRTA